MSARLWDSDHKDRSVFVEVLGNRRDYPARSVEVFRKSRRKALSLRNEMSWTPKIGQGPKVENRCLKEKACKGSGSSTRQRSRQKSHWKRLRGSVQFKNWLHITGYIRIKSRIGKNSWSRKLRKFSRAAGFMVTKLWSKKKRSSISRSESCRWNWTGFKKSLGSCDAERETRMHRRGSEDIEHRAEVPTDRTAALDVVLHTAERDGGESEADAALGSAIHAHAVLRKPTHGDCAGTAGLDGQSQTDSATHAADGHRSDLS